MRLLAPATQRARSKAKARPGPRRTASASSNETPNEASSATAEADTDHVSGVCVAVARRKRFRHCVVFATTFGKCYHRVSRFKLDSCNDLRSLDPDAAVARGLRLRKKCNA